MIKYIFCVNPGRTGSEYLSRLFSCVENVASFHEPNPILHGPEMRSFLTGDPHPMNAMMDTKLSFIKDSLKEKRYYVEANHCFIKGFGWLLPGRLPEAEIGVIILKRNRELVVDSLYKVNAHPFTTTGEKWIITPQFYKNNVTPYPKEYSKAGFLFLKLQYRFFNRVRKVFPTRIPDHIVSFAKTMIGWYVDETYALGDVYRKKFPLVKVVELSVTELNTKDGLDRLLSEFRIPAEYTEDMNGVIGKKVNEREHAIKFK
jgi:hypothetical protein